MTCALVQAWAPGAARQTVSWVPCTARAFQPPDGPGASVAVPGGSTGSGRHEPAVLIVAARRWLRVRARLPSAAGDADVREAPFSGSGGDSVQCAAPSVDHAASRRAAGPLPAASSAVVVWPLVGEPEDGDGLVGVAGGQHGPGQLPRPAGAGEDPGYPAPAAGRAEQRLPRPAERGCVEGAWPAAGSCGGPARAWRVVSRVHPVPPGREMSAVPLVSSASRRPLAGSAARAPGTSASPASSRLGDQDLPSSLVVASGE